VSAAATPETVSARERILATAADLFYEHGFHAVGIDLVIERAGVAKTTLYRHFASKDDLIVAYLERANEQFWAWFDSSLDENRPARDQLLAVFDATRKLAVGPGCLGCAFQVTAAEFPAADHPGHRTALAHKQAVRASLRALAADAGATDPSRLADALLLLMDGAFAAARMYRRSSPATAAADAARVLIDAHTPTPPPFRSRKVSS
jgi:AcrR family transcriptional regulator